MKIAIKFAAAVLVLLASAPAFAHGGGTGHMGGNMSSNMSGNTSGNMGSISHPTVIGNHHGDHRYTKTASLNRRFFDRKFHKVRADRLSGRRLGRRKIENLEKSLLVQYYADLNVRNINGLLGIAAQLQNLSKIAAREGITTTVTLNNIVTTIGKGANGSITNRGV